MPFLSPLAFTSPQSPSIYLPSFLQLMSFWFSFPLAFFFLNLSKSNMKDRIVTMMASRLFHPSICFSFSQPFHNKDHRDWKAEITSWRRFFQHSPHSATYNAAKQEYKTLQRVEDHRNVIKTGTQKPSPP